MSTPIDRLAAKVAAMTPRPWIDAAARGFIDTADAHLLQTWNKMEEDFPNAAANRAGIVALANVADELLDVARAAQHPDDLGRTGLREALAALNAKLAGRGRA